MEGNKIMKFSFRVLLVYVSVQRVRSAVMWLYVTMKTGWKEVVGIWLALRLKTNNQSSF
jgi:hypothetical protein